MGNTTEVIAVMDRLQAELNDARDLEERILLDVIETEVVS